MLRKNLLPALTLLLLLTSAARAQQADPLAAGWASPPNSAKPHTWWHWMNGNVSKAGITADLEAMKRVGIGGAHLAQVGTGIPQGPVAQDSPEMVDMVQFAFKEADRLGLDLCLFNCPGWSSSGGPWIKPENSMKVLAYTETTTVGGKHAVLDLAQPTATQNFYRDACWLAYPTPAADSRLPNFNNGRGNARGGAAATASAPAAGAEPIDPAKVIDLSKGMNDKGQLECDLPAGNWTILRIGFTTTGTTNRPAPDGGTGLEIDKFSKEALDFHFNYFFGKYFDVMKPLAAKGKVAALIDSYETGLQNWTDNFPEEFRKRRGYDITPYMPAMMLGRIVGSADISQRFLWDVRKTQAELMNENYYAHFTELCHQHGMQAYTEPYDNGNFDEMIAGSYADMPMAEFWQGQANQRSIKLVASVMHMNGKPVMGAESFTSQSRWTESPYSLKALGDFMWTQGLNQFIFHRFAMQPNTDPSVFPGMTMGPWGGHFDRTNTWFEPGKAWMDYIARSQFLLQQGTFVGDLAYFCGEDSPVRNPDESRLNPAPPPGYGYDTIDPQTMHNRVKIDSKGLISLPDGLTYRAMVVQPTVRTMSVDTIQMLHNFVQSGMTLVVSGPKPTTTPSLMNYPNADATVAKLSADLWADMDGTTKTSHDFGTGHVYWGVPLVDVLEKKLNAKPDFEFTSRSGTADINYIHRHLDRRNVIGESSNGTTAVPFERWEDGAEIYFIANRGAQSEDLVCTFQVAGIIPELWDSVTGRHIVAPVFSPAENGTTAVPLQLPPSASAFVVFRPVPTTRLEPGTQQAAAIVKAPPYITSITRDGTVLISTGALAANNRPAQPMGIFPRANQRPLALPPTPAQTSVEAGSDGALAWENGTYTVANFRYLTVDSRGESGPQKGTASFPITRLPAPAEITGPWHLNFPPKLGAPAQAEFDKLISWPDSPDPGIKYFSGTATYSRKISITPEQLAKPNRLFLDLGRVQVIAQIRLNGKDLATLWTFPFRTDITDAAHSGDNDLEIRVTNLWPNRLIGDENLPAENQYFTPAGRGGAPANPVGPAAGRGQTTNAILQLPDWYLQNKPKPPGGRITFTTWHHWSATDPLLESGLIGPVVLRTAVPLSTK
jgi:hypothetical protein